MNLVDPYPPHPFHLDVHAPVLVSFEHTRDARLTAHRGYLPFLKKDDPERTPRFQTIRDHLLVPGLEDMQGQFFLREEHHSKWKKRYAPFEGHKLLQVHTSNRRRNASEGTRIMSRMTSPGRCFPCADERLAKKGITATR